MLEFLKFIGIIGINNNDNKFYDFYKFGENFNMLIDSLVSLQVSNGGGFVVMFVDNSSVGFNDLYIRILNY